MPESELPPVRPTASDPAPPPGPGGAPSPAAGLDPAPAPGHASSRAPAPTPSPAPQGYGQVARRGLVLTMVSFAVNKGFVTLAQLVLAIALTPSEYGLYAVAFSISLFIQTFRDGGVRELLTQQPKRYHELEGSLFWLSVTINMIVALILGIAGEVVARVYVSQGRLAHVEDLTTLVWVMAAAVPLGSPTVVLHAKLRIDLNFRAQAWFTIISGVVRYGGQIALALLDFGAMSIVLPTVAVALAETAFCVVVTGRMPWLGKPETWRWRGVIAQTIWVIGASTAAGVANAGYMLVVGLFVPQADLGVYFFAVQLLMQIETLVGQSIVTVMFPIMARMQGEPARQGSAAIRVVRATGLVVAPLAVLLGVLWPAIDLVVFQGKWALAATPILILGMFYPIRTIMVAVPNAALQATGRFREWFFLWLTTGVGLLVVAGIAGWALRDVDALAWCVGAFLALSGLYFTVTVVHRLHVRRREIILSSLLTPLIAAGVGVGCVVLDYAVLRPWLYGEGLNLRVGPGARRALMEPALIRAVVLGGGFLIVYGLAVRTLAQHQVHEALQVMPARLRGPIARVLRLR